MGRNDSGRLARIQRLGLLAVSLLGCSREEPVAQPGIPAAALSPAGQATGHVPSSSLGAAVAKGAGSEPAYRSILLAESAASFAFDSATRRLVAVFSEAGVVRIYPPAFLDGTLGAEPEPIQVGGSPFRPVLKRFGERTYLLLARSDQPALNAVDIESGVVRRIGLIRGPATSIAVSNRPDDPFVAYLFMNSGAVTTTMGRITLDGFRDLGPIPGREIPFTPSSDGGGFDLSPNAELIYASRIYRLTGWNRPHGPVNVEPLATPTSLPAKRLVDPEGRFLAVGDTPGAVFDALGASRLGDLPGPPESFVPGRPLMIASKGHQLWAVSTNTLQPFRSSVDLSELARTSVPGPPPRRMYIFADPARSNLIVACGRRLAVVPLDALGVRSEPSLLLKPIPQALVSSGRTWTLVLEPEDNDVRIELNRGIEGLTLEGRTLNWTPAREQVGSHEVILRVSKGTVERYQNLQIRVTEPQIHLGWRADHLALSPDGKIAIVWNDANRLRQDPTETPRIAKIDLETLAITEQHTLNAPILSAAIDSGGLHVLWGNGEFVQSLDTARSVPGEPLPSGDASLGRYVPRRSGAAALSTPVEGFLVVSNRDTHPEAFLATPSLAPSAALPLPSTPFPWQTPTPLPYRSGGLLWIGGVGIDPDAQPARVQGLDSDAPFSLFHLQPDALNLPTLPHWMHYWGVKFEESDFRQRILNYDGVDVANFEAGSQFRGPERHPAKVIGMKLHAAYPMAVTLEAEQRRPSTSNPGGFTSALWLVLRDLPFGQPRESFRLLENDGLEQGSLNLDNHTSGLTDLLCTQDRIIALAVDRVFSPPIDRKFAQSLPVPLHFERTQAAFVLDPKGPTALPYKLLGGQPPYKVELVDERLLSGKLVQLHTAADTVTVDGAAVTAGVLEWVRYLAWDENPEKRKMLKEPLTRPTLPFRIRGRHSAIPGTQTEEAARRLQRAAFARIVGRESAGVPFTMPIHLKATDSSGVSTRLDFAVYVDIPEPDYEAALRVTR